MLSREFPSPPQLNDLLRSYGTSPDCHDRGKIAMEQISVFMQQHRTMRPRLQATSGVKQSAAFQIPGLTTKVKPSRSSSTTLATEQRSKLRREKAEKERLENGYQTEGQATWNPSTQLPPAPTKPLRHQLLDKSYQPPAPLYVHPSEATELMTRLGKTTVSSRMKGAPHQDSLGLSPDGVQQYGGETEPVDSAQPDTRAKDAIQMLLFYRREVEKRLQRDAEEQKRKGHSK